MSSRTCPNWPDLMELAPDLQFMHYTVAEAQLPVEVLTAISHVSLGDVAICCDLEHHVFYDGHTDPEVLLLGVDRLDYTKGIDVRIQAVTELMLDGDLDPAALVELMGRDKKAYDGLTFVLDGPRGPEIVTEVEDRQVLAALERVRP